MKNTKTFMSCINSLNSSCRYKLRIQYNGQNYKGWQAQSIRNDPSEKETVQQVIEVCGFLNLLFEIKIFIGVNTKNYWLQA